MQYRFSAFRGVPIENSNSGPRGLRQTAVRILVGERATTPVTDAERRAAFQEFRTQKLLPRVLAGLTALSAQPQVDTQRMAAIGFCLGGMTALELARFGGR